MRRPNALKFPLTLEGVACTGLAPGGAGVAHVELAGERRALFVAGAAPGDRLTARVDADGRPLRGSLEALEEPGPLRRATPCAVAARCGGCDWMHLTPTARPELYADLLHEAWPREVPMPEPTFHEAEVRLRTRTHARLAVEAHGGPAMVAFHGLRSAKLVPAEHCLALAPALEAARLRFGEILRGSRGSGQLVLSLGRVAHGEARRAVAHLRFRGELRRDAFTRLEREVGANGSLQGAAVVEEGSLRPALVGDVAAEILGFDDAPLAMPLGGFQQASERGNQELARHVASVARAFAEKHREAPKFPVVELYAGAGNLSVALAPHARGLVTVESADDATALARVNLRARGQDAKIVTGDAAAFVWEKGTRLLVLDPPREGAPSVAKRLAEVPVPYVVYVACDPVALARDAATLHRAGYVAARLDQFELFPETSHAETVAVFTRGRA
jgi:23S rRNA (uracil1939-C5)-methyltransferase